MKKSFLKKLSLGLAAVMTVASLSACGKDNTSSDGANTETGASESTEVSTSTGADTLVVGKDTSVPSSALSLRLLHMTRTYPIWFPSVYLLLTAKVILS